MPEETIGDFLKQEVDKFDMEKFLEEKKKCLKESINECLEERTGKKIIQVSCDSVSIQFLFYLIKIIILNI